MERFRELFPLVVKIAAVNPYRLPVGKIFRAQRKNGDGSPFPIVVRGNWPDFFHGREYQMRESEVAILPGEPVIWDSSNPEDRGWPYND
jgi:hypothetical protein